MQGFMKTILSALQTWVNKRIKSNAPDWNQNDSNGDGYIKNRPFYTSNCEVINIMPEATISYDNTNSNLTESLVVGNTYIVTFDGVDYECECREYDGYRMLGNNAIYEYDDGIMTDTGEPFAVETSGDDTSMYWYFQEGDTKTHAVSIFTLTESVKKLDRKYLPEFAPVATSGNYWDLEDIPDSYSDVVRYGASQSLTTAQKTVAKNNIGAVGYDAAQSLTTAQKTQARANIDAVSSSEITGVVKYTQQTLTEEEKAQARKNIGSVEVFDIEKARDYIALIDQNNGYTYIIEVRDGNLVSYNSVKSIQITTMPDKTNYVYSEYFDPTGMVVTATCQDGSTREITKYTYITEYLTEDMTSVDIVYKEAGISHKATVPVTVSAFDPATVLIDFTYTDNGNNTYTLTGWKGTLNGESSTEIIIPNCACIIV